MNRIQPPSESPPTLLVFTLGDRRESRRRNLLPVSQGALERRLHRACLEATLEAGRAAGYRLEVSAPAELGLPEDVEHRPQHTGAFGTRIQAALGEAFEAGGPVALVGTDVPGLEPKHLRKAADLLAEDPERVVLGPSPDGGFYLLAAARPIDEALADVRWCCRQTLRSLKQALRRQGRALVLLAPLADLDRRADLERWLATEARYRAVSSRSAWGGLIDRLLRLLAELRQTLGALPAPVPRPHPRPALALRGPPALRFS